MNIQTVIANLLNTIEGKEKMLAEYREAWWAATVVNESQVRNSLFAERNDIVDAYKYVEQVANASNNPAAVYTAVHVLMNTIAKELLALEEVEQ